MIKPLPPSIFRENSRRYGFLLFLFFSFFLSIGAFAQTYAPTVTSDKDDYAPGEVATITGSGWTQDQMVHVEFKEEPDYPDTHVYDIATDVNGSWVIKYNIETRHLGVRFTVTSVGKQTGVSATTIFTDGSVLFRASELPDGVPVSLQGTYSFNKSSKNLLGFVTNNKTNPPGQTGVVPDNGSTVNFSYPAIITYLGVNYSLIGLTSQLNENSPVVLPITTNNGRVNGSVSAGGNSQIITVSAAYQISCSAPSITSQPGNQLKTYGENANFTVAASGTPTLTYKWEEFITSWNAISDGGVYSGTATATLSLTKPPVAMNGRKYRCIVTGTCNPTATSDGNATLTVKSVELTPAIVANNKPYDGTTTATLSSQSVSGMITGETVGLAVTAANFASKDKGTHTVTATGLSLTGDAAANYTLATGATATDAAEITAKTVTASITASNKVYDGTTTVTATGSVPATSIISGDLVDVTVTNAAFNNKNVGTDKAVTANVSISNSNYSLTATSAATTADITAKQLIPAIVANDKMFDNTTTATLSSQTVSGMITGETVGLAITAANFASKERGTHIVTATGLSLTGDATVTSNYFLAAGATATNDATIFVAPTVTLSTPSPIAVNTISSIVTASLGLDVFKTEWIYTSPIANTKIVSPTKLEITSSTPVVYSVSMKYENGIGESFTTPSVYAVFYDPSAGFVTGGGWILSPKVAELPLMAVEGKANFGFESRYEKGKSIPSGNTEFQFHAGGINFKSTAYEWLVLASNKAQYKGVGTINGSGSYGFMLTAIDGDLGSTKTTDKFRIKIWNKNNGDAVVYDNQYLAADGVDPSTALGGGSIVIHEVKTNGKSERVTDAADMFTATTKLTFTAYPNPVREAATIEFAFPQDEDYSLDIYDVQGVLVKHLPGGKAKANTTVQVKWDAANTAAGVYIVRLVTNSGVQNLRVVRE